MKNGWAISTSWLQTAYIAQIAEALNHLPLRSAVSCMYDVGNESVTGEDEFFVWRAHIASHGPSKIRILLVFGFRNSSRCESRFLRLVSG